MQQSQASETCHYFLNGRLVDASEYGGWNFPEENAGTDQPKAANPSIGVVSQPKRSPPMFV